MAIASMKWTRTAWYRIASLVVASLIGCGTSPPAPPSPNAAASAAQEPPAGQQLPRSHLGRSTAPVPSAAPETEPGPPPHAPAVTVSPDFQAQFADTEKSHQQRIEQAKQVVANYKRGHVIVGKVVVEKGDDPALVHSQMLILDDGFFAGPTSDLERPVGFRLHQYAPIDLQLQGKTGDIVDVGTIKLHRLSSDELVPLKGQLVLEGSTPPRAASVSLSTYVSAINTPHNGTEPRPKWQAPVIVEISDAGMLDSRVFSPMEYYCSINAPGYVSKSLVVTFQPEVGADIGKITLEKSKRIVLEYVTSKSGPFDAASTKKKTLSAGDRWKATPEIYGWDLEFKQKEGKLFFDYSYSPCFMTDLGNGELKNFVNVKEDEAKDDPRSLAVKAGCVYLLNHQQSWKRNVLFKVIEIQNAE
jgi:hypothetical protein